MITINNKRISTLIFVVAPIIILVAVIIKTLHTDTPSKARNTIGNSNGNMMNYGIVCEQGASTFFLNTGDSNNSILNLLSILGIGSFHKTYFINANEKKLHKVKTPLYETGYYLNVIGNKMFYINFTSAGEYATGGDLYSHDINGTWKKKIADSIQGKYIIYKNNIYCCEIDNSQTDVVEYDLNGKRVKKIASSKFINDIELYNDKIYYISDEKESYDNLITGSLYRMNIDGSYKELVLKGPLTTNYIIDDGIVYYQRGYDDKELYEFDINSCKNRKLSIGQIIFNVSDNWIYYSDEKNNLYKIKFDGTDKELLYSCKFYIGSINLTRDWVYFCELDNNTPLYRIRKDGEEFSVLKFLIFSESIVFFILFLFFIMIGIFSYQNQIIKIILYSIVVIIIGMQIFLAGFIKTRYNLNNTFFSISWVVLTGCLIISFHLSHILANYLFRMLK